MADNNRFATIKFIGIAIQLYLCNSLALITKYRSSGKYYSLDGSSRRKWYLYQSVLQMQPSHDGYSSFPELTPTKQNIETVDLSERYDDEMRHNYFMDLALAQAQRARDMGEVPIGAIIVGCFDNETILSDGYTSRSQINKSSNHTTFQILSRAHNLIETNMDASAHAELLALRQGAQKLKNWRYPPNSTLYTTLEPCPMCLASLQAFRIDNIVYGAPDHRLGAIESHVNLMSVVKHPFHEIKSVVGGVKRDECSDILVDFFRQRRKIVKERKQKVIREAFKH